MNDSNTNEGTMEGVVNMGKGILSVLKETATVKIAETKEDALEIGENLLDKGLLHIKHIGFIIVGALLLMVAAVDGLAAGFQIPTWASALFLGIATFIAAYIFKKKSEPRSDAEVRREPIEGKPADISL